AHFATDSRGLDLGTFPVPVDRGDAPPSPGECDRQWTVVRAAKHHRVDESDLGAPLEDRELGGSGEHSHHVPEVHTAVPSLGGGACEEKFAVLYEKLLG